MFSRVFFISILTLATTMTQTGCRKDNSTTPAAVEGKVGTLDFKILQNTSLSFEGTTLKGTGDAIAKLPLAESKAGGKNLALTFSVDDGGTLSVKTFASATLENGINIVFTRTGSELKIKTTHKQDTSTEKTLSVNSSSQISVAIDVHNDESPAHILVWNGTESTPTESNALFNTESDGNSAGQGAENFWGVSLSKATLSNVTISEPKYEDD